MPALSPLEQAILQTHPHKASVYLSLYRPKTLLSGDLDIIASSRGDTIINYVNGIGTGYPLIEYGHTLWVGTTSGSNDVGKVQVRGITGSQASGTITIAPNSIVWRSGYFLTVKRNYELFTKLARTDESGFQYRDYNILYTDQNEKPLPIPIIGPQRFGFLDNSNSITFLLDSTGSYTVDGTAILSTLWECDGGTIASPSSASTSITFTDSDLTSDNMGQFWLKATITGIHGSIQAKRLIMVHVNDYDSEFYPYNEFSFESTPASSYDQGSWLTKLNVHGTADFQTFQDGALLGLWTVPFYGSFTSPVGLPKGENQLMFGFSLSDTVEADWDKGTVSFEVGSITELMKQIRVSPFSLESVPLPTLDWNDYPNVMTMAQAIHNQIYWSSNLFELTDVFLPTDNELGKRRHDFSEGGFYQQISQFSYDSGLLARFGSNKLGQLWIETDPQFLDSDGRGAVTIVKELEVSDRREDIVFIHNPIKSTGLTRVTGFSWDGSVEEPYCSVAPGEVPENHGSSLAQTDRQILADQDDCNRVAGRMHAKENNPIPEIRVKMQGNYAGVCDIFPREAWLFNHTASENTRGIEFVNHRLYVSNVDTIIDQTSLTILTDVVFEPEANFSEDGVPYDCEKNVPEDNTPPGPANQTIYPQKPIPASIVTFTTGGTYVLDDGSSNWSNRNAGLGNSDTVDLTGVADPNWQETQASVNPDDAIFFKGLKGKILKSDNSGRTSWTNVTPADNPPNTWLDPIAPTTEDVSFVHIIANPYVVGEFYAIAEWAEEDAGDWRGWLAVTQNYGEDWEWKELDTGTSDQYRPIRMAIAGDGAYLFATAWRAFPFGSLVLTKRDIEDFSEIATYDLGSAEKEDIDSRHWWAIPSCPLLTADLVIVAGRMANIGGQGFGHIGSSNNAGVDWTIFENGWGGDFVAEIKTRINQETTEIEYLISRVCRNAFRSPD